jgi:general stress protein 26
MVPPLEEYMAKAARNARARTKSDDASRRESVERLREMIKGIRFAMMTTARADGTLHSRPMATQQIEFDGDLWFFTGKASTKVKEIRNDQHVNLSYADPDSNHYVSIAGRASVVRDRAKVKAIWNPFYRTWFPKGIDDPNLALMKVRVDSAEVWDSPSSTMVHLYGIVKATLTGKRPKVGDHRKMDLKPSRRRVPSGKKHARRR